MEPIFKEEAQESIEFEFAGRSFMLQGGLGYELVISGYPYEGDAEAQSLVEQEVTSQIIASNGVLLGKLVIEYRSVPSEHDPKFLTVLDEPAFYLNISDSDGKKYACSISNYPGDQQWYVQNPKKKKKNIIHLPIPYDVQQTGYAQEIQLAAWEATSDGFFNKPFRQDYVGYRLVEVDGTYTLVEHSRRIEGGPRAYWEIKDTDWEASQNGSNTPFLLFVHGTNGTAEEAFMRILLNDSVAAELMKKYNNNVLFFEYPSVVVAAGRNHKVLQGWLSFLKRTRNISVMNMDVVTRSLGSLLVRKMIEKAKAPAWVNIDKLVMLAGPNQGSHSGNGYKNGLRAITITKFLRQMDRQPASLEQIHFSTMITAEAVK
ncbi:MAG: hypothetical protein AAF206_25975, partial [Bacteroidota bacterium]